MNRPRVVIFLAALFAFSGLELHAQVQSTTPIQAPNTIYAELGGKGLAYGLYYERLVSGSVGLTIGFSTWSFSFFSSIDVTIIPLFVSWYSVGQENHLYVDAGIDYASLSAEIGPFGTAAGSGVIPILGSGYCYRNNNGGLYFKVGPLLLFAPGRVQPWGNLTLGATF
jgi:hypothetical protein